MFVNSDLHVYHEVFEELLIVYLNIQTTKYRKKVALLGHTMLLIQF